MPFEAALQAYRYGSETVSHIKDVLERNHIANAREVKDYMKPWNDEHGIQYIGVEQFLLDETLLG